MLSRPFIAALWSPAGKELTSWPSFVIFNCVFVTVPCGILGQVCYFNVYIPDSYPVLTLIWIQTLCYSERIFLKRKSAGDKKKRKLSQ